MKPKAKNKRKPGGSEDPRAHNAEKHGMNTLTRYLAERGTWAIDGRSLIGRKFAAWREAINTDLGGRENLSQLQEDERDRYLYLSILIESGVSYCLQQKSIVNKRTRSLLPVVRDLARLIDSASRLAQSLGLQRREKPTPSLAEYLQSKNQPEAENDE